MIFSGFWPNSNQDSLGRNHRANLEPILTWCWPAEPAEPPALVVWRPWSPVPAQRQAACSGCCLCCPAPAEPVVPSASHETQRQIPGFLWAFCFIWLCGGCASRAHPGSLAGRRRRLAPGCRLSLLALLPCSTFYVSFPFYFFLPRYLFFFLLFQHGFPKKFFNQSNLRQKIGFVTPGPGIV